MVSRTSEGSFRRWSRRPTRRRHVVHAEPRRVCRLPRRRWRPPTVPVRFDGEFPSPAREQRKTVIETLAVTRRASRFRRVWRHVRRRHLAYVRDARGSSADAAGAVTPYYLDASQPRLRRFFRDVAGQPPLPVFLYNVPKLTGIGLSVESVARLRGPRTRFRARSPGCTRRSDPAT